MENIILKPYKERKLKCAAEVAQVLVSHAKNQARRLLLEAQKQATTIASKAQESGLKEGQKKALACLISSEALLAEALNNSKQIIIEIAHEIAKEILMQEVTLNPQSLIPRVELLISRAVNARKIKIHANPLVVEQISKIVSNYPDYSKVEVVKDSKLEITDLKVSTELGEISSNLKTELNEISTSLTANYSKICR